MNTLVELDLRVVKSEFGDLVGTVRIFLWLRWFEDRGKLIVARPEQTEAQLGIHEVLPASGDIEALASLLDPLLVSTAGPNLHANGEYESDLAWWADVTLRARVDERSMSIRMGLPGFAVGEDAGPLRLLFERLLMLADVRDQPSWYILTGKNVR